MLANFSKDVSGMADVPFYYIYGVPADAETASVHFERISDRQILHDGQVEAHRHPHLYQISLWRGGGRYLMDREWRALPERALVVMPPTITHGFEIAPGADAMVISVSASFVTEMKARLGNDSWSVLEEGTMLTLSEEVDERLTTLFGAVEEEYRFSFRHSRDALACHLQLIVILTDRLLGLTNSDLAPSADERLLAAFLGLIDQKLKSRWTIQQYVEVMGTTPYLLNRATSRAFGMTAIELVRDRTVAEAKRLLLFSKTGASEIGFVLGFDDPAHFARFFRRKTGLSPTSWRRRQIDLALDA